MSYHPPVYSPLSLSGIATAFRAALSSEAEGDLEAMLATSFNADHVVLTRSGTHALQLAIRTLAGKDHDRLPVALPAYSCFDLVTAAHAAGVRVTFYDVDPVTLSPDLPTLEGVLAGGVSCVVAGNLYGFPLAFEAVRSACDRAGVPLIEDAAQGVGTSTSAGAGGSLGDATVLSFGRGKGWTGGGGGAALFRGTRAPYFGDAAVPTGEMDSGLKSGVTTLVAWALGRPSMYGIPASIPWLGLGTTQYHEPSPVRAITRFSTRLALETSSSALSAPDQRRLVAAEWTERLSGGLAGLTPCEPLGGPGRASFLRYPVVADTPAAAQSIEESCGHLGVARGYPVPLPELPQGRPLHAGEQQSFPGSECLASRLLTLPVHHWIDAGVMDRFADTVRRRVG